MAGRTSVSDTSDSSAIRFEGTVRTIDGRAILRFPAESSAKLPSRGQVAVKAQMNGHAFDTVIEPDGRRGHWLAIDEELWKVLGLSSDDAVKLEVEPTKIWPEPEVPADLQTAIDQAPDIAEVWENITPMARWEWVRWINATRNPQTRERRVEVSISKMRSGKRRPCCFDLASCTDPQLSKSGKLIDVSVST